MYTADRCHPINAPVLYKYRDHYPLPPWLPHQVNARENVLILHSACLLLTSSQQSTVVKLSDEVLLNIFRYYLDASPRFWAVLVHICGQWRRIVFENQRCLHLRLYCTHRTPVSKIPDCWPALPIVVEYGGSPGLEPLLEPWAWEDEDNIMALLQLSDRVTFISLTVTNSLLVKLFNIKRPFSELEDLILLSRDAFLTLPRDFIPGTRLRRLHLTRIACPVFLHLLLSSRSLVDLRLHEVPNPWPFSPEDFTNALAGMTKLRSLSLHLLFPINYFTIPPPSGKRVHLPGLTSLKFRGATPYLEGLVARIDAPRLGDIEVTFFNQFIPDLSELGDFMDRIETHKSHCQTHIVSSEHTISISLTQPGAPTCLLQLLCEPLNVQLSSMAQICTRLSAFLFNVDDIRISATRQSSRMDSLCSGLWLELINSFTTVKWLHLDGSDSINVLRALQPLDRRREHILPALNKLCIQQSGPRLLQLNKIVVSFLAPLRLSGRPIAVEYERSCHTSEPCEPGTISA